MKRSPPRATVNQYENGVLILISAPSLSTAVNVSGVSTVVSRIITGLSGKFAFDHLMLGSPTQKASAPSTATYRTTFAAIIKSIKSKAKLYHSNTALNPKSILRDVIMTSFAKLTGKKILLHLHGGKYLSEPPPLHWDLSIRILFSLADAIVSLSETEKNIISERYKTKKNIHSVYNFVDFSEEDKSINIGSPLSVLFAGRLVEEKGVRTLLEVASNSDPLKIQFYFYGSGPLLNEVEDASRHTSNISYQGIFSGAETSQILRSHDVIVLPSLSGEGMPMIIIEGMSAGLVPIATSLGSIPEIINDGRTGYIIAPNCAESLATKLNMIAGDRALLAELSAASQSYAKQAFSSQRNLDMMEVIYRSLLS